MIDWTKAIEAVPVRGGKTVRVSVNKSFHHIEPSRVVDFSANPWCDNAASGNYTVDSDGLITVGKSPDGYNARYYVRNVGDDSLPHHLVVVAREAWRKKLFRSAIKNGLPEPVL